MAKKKGKEMDTRAALLDSAWALFQVRGYDAVSVDAIVRRAGLSKGTFFHYFASKLDLLEAVCEMVSERPWTALSAKVRDGSLPALSRLDLLVSGMREWRLGHIGALLDFYRALARDENTLLRLKLTARQDDLFRSALVEILDQGNREGVFHVPDVEETARLVCAVAGCTSEGNLRQLAQPSLHPGLAAALERRAEAGMSAIERLLAARPGTLARVGAATFRRIVRAERARARARPPPA